tara:strand:+ start:1594 stop:1827 length:234 start_codon:yes stop_codon:yes gene_type:complete
MSKNEIVKGILIITGILIGLYLLNEIKILISYVLIAIRTYEIRIFISLSRYKPIKIPVIINIPFTISFFDIHKYITY